MKRLSSGRVPRLAVLLAPLLAIPSCGMGPALAESDALRAGPYDPLVGRFVSFTLERQHFLKPTIDDEVSAQWLDRYLDNLDPRRWFFLRSDVDEFREKYATSLDDAIRGGGNIDAAYEIYNRYQTRVQERIAQAKELIDQPVDFTVAESLPLDRSESPWPATAEDAIDLWRLHQKNELLVAQLNETDLDEARETLAKRWDRIEKAALDVEAVDVRELYLNALTTSVDPHSNYLKPFTSEDFNIDLSNQLEGIGAVLQPDDGFTKVRSLVPGGPAAKTGRLQEGDRIVAVKQEDEAQPVDIVDMRLDKVVRLIRGPKGSSVTLVVVPDGAALSERREVVIVRDKVELTERMAKSEVETIEHEGKEWKLGIIELPTFYPAPRGATEPTASSDIRRLIGELDEAQVDGLVLDLRKNGGGSLSEAVEVAGLFIPQGPVVQVHGPSGTEVLEDPDPSTVYGGPLVVLTSPLSASASEIVAGAVQDYGRGLIVGAQTTHGKGTVQTVQDLEPLLMQRIGRRLQEPQAGAMKFTIQKFYRVTGASTQFRGVESDIVLPTPYDGLDVFESDLDHALPWDEIAPTRFTAVGQTASALPQLRERSKARVAEDPDFAELKDRLAYRQEMKDRDSLSLLLSERQAEADAYKARFGDDATSAEDSPADLLQDTDEDDSDPVRAEALRILADYIQVSRS